MFKKFWDKNKEKPLFKGKILAVILVIAAVAVNFFYSDSAETQTSDETASAESAEENPPPQKEFKIGASNVIVLGGCVIALAVVKHRDENIRK